MANWKYRLDIPFFHNEDMTLEEKTKKIIETIKSRPWFNDDFYYVNDLSDILEEISDAGEANDVDWFDSAWDAAYDIFDAERVWVVTR